ncbi:MAG: YbaK/EbsC family protein [Caldilineae bacterium]|nr:MAG: YbaK/EbsC family protein [Caldilineae bacterium]
MRTPEDLARYLLENGIDAELLRDVGDTPTVEAAARALGVSPQEILKTLIFFCRGEPYAVIGHGTEPISDRALADYFGVGKRQIRLARAPQVLELTGYAVGGVPPFGHRTRLPTLVDRGILSFPVVYGGGGDDHTMLKITPAELVRVTDATPVELNHR